jgi:hypothetical protein
MSITPISSLLAVSGSKQILNRDASVLLPGKNDYVGKQ